ncbi:glycosyltransferase [Vulcanisaeta thermophila]|uniref:glycosyltransferase n=1 Tax=Vulcanisaeta thermophila TaxID=867917 RepID=UPI000852B2EE|nr:glycosyltransferase [Vulcanisaeta thermophila]
MSNENELVSIIVPVKNEARRIMPLLNGIAKQTYKAIEVIFVDGGSTDGTYEILQEFQRRSPFPVKVLREEGPLKSPANARNLGILNSNGKYVVLFDADFDLSSDENAIYKIVNGLKKGKHVAITYIANEHTWLERQQALETSLLFGFNGKPLYLLAGFRREVFEKELFDVRLGLGEDVDFVSRVSPRKEYVIVDTAVRRCFPHTIHDLKKQQLWYGRTAIPYLKKNNKVVWLYLARINAVPMAVYLSIIMLLLAFFTHITYPILVISFLLLSYSLGYRILGFLIRDVKKLKLKGAKNIFERLIYILLRELIAKLFFDIGIISYLIKRGKVVLGRE